MFTKFVSKFLLVLLPLTVLSLTATANSINLKTQQQNDDIAPGTSVFEYAKKSAGRAPTTKSSGSKTSSNVCSSENCRRQRSLKNTAPKINLGAQAQKSLALGDALYKAGKFKEAAAAYQKAVRLKPNYAAYFGLGEASYELKQPAEALVAYNQAVKLNPRLDEAFYNVGTIHFEQKNYQAALTVLEQAIKVAPAEADEYYYYGLTLSELKQNDQAIAALREAIRINPKFADAAKKLADIYASLKRFPEAIDLLNQFVKQNPNDGAAFFNLGNAYFDSKKTEDALAAYQEAVRLMPNDAKSIENLADTHYSLTNPAEAAKNYEKALQLNPELKKDWGFAVRYGNSLRQVNKSAEAVRWLTEAAKINSKEDNPLWLLGILYADQTPPNYPLAIEYFNQAAKLNPERKETFLGLVNAYINSSPRQPNEALQSARRVQQLAPNDAMAQFAVGSALAIGELWEPALQAFKEAARLDPKNGSVRVQLCNAMWVLNKQKEGLPECEQAVRLSTPEEKPIARTALANMYARSKQYDKAIAEFNAVIKEKPDFFFAHMSLGQTYGLMKKYDKAIEALKKAINLQPEMAELHFILGTIYWDAKKKSEYLQEYGILLNLSPKYAEQLRATVEMDKKKK